MKTVTFTEFRKHASGLMNDVEHGETLLVVRHGRPIAEVCPVSSSSDAVPSWKKPGLRLAGNGVSLSAAILEERVSEGIL
jgi:prevent-host-death family protein